MTAGDIPHPGREAQGDAPGRGSFLVRSLSRSAPRGGHGGPSVRPVSCRCRAEPSAVRTRWISASRRRPAVPGRGGVLGAPSAGRRNRGWTSPPGPGRPALRCDAATREHLCSRECCARAAPGGKRGEVGTWARGSRGAGASETRPERPSLFGVCRGWGLRAGAARRTSRGPRTAGGREWGAPEGGSRGPPGRQGRGARPGTRGSPGRRSPDGPGAAWPGRRGRVDPERLSFQGAALLGRDRELSIRREGAPRRRVMSADQLLARREGLLPDKVAAATATAAPRSLGGEGQVGEGRRDGCGGGS